jgi:hypothetical protein
MIFYKPKILIIGSDNDVNIPQIIDWLICYKANYFF